MVVRYSILIVVIGLSFTQGVYHKAPTVKKDLSTPLSLDEAYLIVRNTNYSNNIVLFGNKIICEDCDLEQMAVAMPNQNATLVINTKYAYNLELRSWLSNISLLCQMASYKFAEHGTYVLDITQVTPATEVCSIEQIGNPSYYLTPAIVGIVLVVLYVVLVQLWPHIYHSRHFDYFRSNIPHQRLIDNNLSTTSLASAKNLGKQIVNENDGDIICATASTSEVPLASSTHLSDKNIRPTQVLPKRLRALDTFRGFSLMVMIFVNYGDTLMGKFLMGQGGDEAEVVARVSGVNYIELMLVIIVFDLFTGGGYWFFDHSIWNGLTLADLLFPWFTWMMGVSIVLSQRSLRSKNVRKRNILLKICRRTIILFVLGFTGEDDITELKNLRILGVLQRLAICYFFTAILVLVLDKKDNGRDATRLPIDDNLEQPLRTELFNSVFQFWIQWLFVVMVITIWLLITFLLDVPNCPTGYLGPGGKHHHGKYWNCTGGAAGYIDRVILGNSHLYNEPTCKEIYHTKVPYDPEGIMGNLTGILLCYIGVQAGHSFVHSSRVRRVCAHWLVSGVICGCLGLILSHGGHSNSWIPINKNLWSLTFVLTLASLAFIILTILYLLVDVHRWFTGAPFLWLGMNSIAIYIGHDRFAASFPVQFEVNSTHAEQLAVHLYGALFWSFVAGFMYYKKIFIAI